MGIMGKSEISDVISFRLKKDGDKEIRQVFDQIANDLHAQNSKVEVKDIVLVLCRAYTGDDSVVIPSHKSIIEEIRTLFDQHMQRRTYDTPEPVVASHKAEVTDEEAFLDELGDLLGTMGVETSSS